MPPAPDGDDQTPQGRLDATTLRTLGRRAVTHPLVSAWSFEPTAISPRFLEIELDADAYPVDVDAVRLELHWFTTDDYYVHYIGTRDTEYYQCRWDRHPKTDAPRSHFHPPPNAGTAVESPLGTHALEVLFTVLDWVSERVSELHES